MPDPGLIAVTIPPAQLDDLRQTLAGVKNGVARAATVAINRTLVTGRSRVVRRILKEVRLKAKDARERIRILKANFQTLAGALRLTRKPVPLVNYGARQTAAGVSVAVRRGGRQVVKGAFLARMKSGHVGVFKRVGKSRLPIKEQYGPTLLGVFQGAPGVAAEVLAELGGVLQQNLASQVDRLLDRKALQDGPDAAADDVPADGVPADDGGADAPPTVPPPRGGSKLSRLKGRRRA